MGTERASQVILGIDPKHGMGLTDPERVQSLRLSDEAVDFVHLIDARFGPAFSLNDFFDFFSEMFHVFREGGQVIDCVRESLFKKLKMWFEHSYESEHTIEDVWIAAKLTIKIRDVRYQSVDSSSFASSINHVRRSSCT